jgi:protein-tyrosine phosphatase
MFQNILILCLGNICRSPIAEKLLQKKAKNAGLALNIDSAGLTAMVGDTAHPFSCKVAEIYGLSLREHVAKQVSFEMIKTAELVLVMDQRQRQMLEQRFQQASGKTFRLGHFSDFDIPDPYGQSQAAFETTYQLIDRATEDWLKELR